MKHIIHITQQELVELAKKQLSKKYPAGFELVIVHGEDVRKEEQNPPLWYPDNSGEWIECAGTRPNNLLADTLVEILYHSERYDQDWTSCIGQVDEWFWGNIVAYKVVKE